MRKARSATTTALFLTLAMALSGAARPASAQEAQQAGSREATTASQTPAAAAAGTSAPAADAVEISSTTISGLGSVLVNGDGHVLYIFEPDEHARVTCTTTCAAVWPPVVVKGGQKAEAEGKVKASMLGTDSNPNGSGQVVTYDGWPLYTYTADTKAGQARGQALNLNGGLWYVISPAGKVIQKKGR